MTAPKPTPEEKLFAVIQGAQHPPLRARAQAISLSSLGARLAVLIGPVDLPRINQALTVVVAVLGVVCVASPLLMQPRVERSVARARNAPNVPVSGAPLEGLHPVDEYLQSMAQQDPFRVGETLRTAVASGDTTSTGHDPRALIAGLKLVGISWGEEPIAMIEQQQQTYFLKQGERLGEVTVKAILQDRVVLQVAGQDIELF